SRGAGETAGRRSDEDTLCADTFASLSLFSLGSRWMRCPSLEPSIKTGRVGGVIRTESTSGHRKWIPLLLGILGAEPYASLEVEDISTRPTPWPFPGAGTAATK